MNLTPHFTLEELLHSQTAVRMGIDNTPTDGIVQALTVTAQGLERIRALLGVPMIISSGYRCPALNAAERGARNSQHMLGQAADFIAPMAGEPIIVAKIIAAHAQDIGFDQLIQEGTWVHVSFIVGEPRREVLTAHFANGSVTYSEGL